jgi:hypothetical protein
MKIILLTKENFAEVVSKHNLNLCVVGNLPTPTLIDPLRDIAYLIAENVEVTHCEGSEFEEFLNGGPLSLQSIHLFSETRRKTMDSPQVEDMRKEMKRLRETFPSALFVSQAQFDKEWNATVPTKRSMINLGRGFYGMEREDGVIVIVDVFAEVSNV